MRAKFFPYSRTLGTGGFLGKLQMQMLETQENIDRFLIRIIPKVPPTREILCRMIVDLGNQIHVQIIITIFVLQFLSPNLILLLKDQITQIMMVLPP
ncbi:unnamed protein product [Lactuca virosa]|uniref:Uncharacterized protein n=1 Tax=Lactuca virosa TaxID=75947 RepID=A0AAU9PGS5_9ASTR|nr:unnamed protein product [Lactuca virosa]